MNNEDYPPMAVQCPSCEAIFILHGDFGQKEGQFVRVSETDWHDCDKCMEIKKHCFDNKEDLP